MMEAIKQMVKIPKNHEIRIKVPAHIPENELAEVILILNLNRKKMDYKEKIEELKKAVDDELFMADMDEVSRDFEHVDMEGWE